MQQRVGDRERLVPTERYRQRETGAHKEIETERDGCRQRD